MVIKFSKKDADTADLGFKVLLDFHRLHVAIGLAVLDAYGLQYLDLEHGFHEVETLPSTTAFDTPSAPPPATKCSSAYLLKTTSTPKAMGRKIRY